MFAITFIQIYPGVMSLVSVISMITNVSITYSCLLWLYVIIPILITSLNHFTI